MCNEIQSWTFIGLVGAFLDLSIAFLLLCASTLAYFVSKFLGLFGLCLPCPCNGLFGDPNGGKCWQRVMVDCPSENISSVQFSVRSKIPFDKIWDKKLKPESGVNLKNLEDKFARLDDEASCSLVQERSGVMCASGVNEEKFDIKGKGVWNQKVRQALRRRRKGAMVNGRSSSVASSETFHSDAQTLPQSPASVIKMVNGSKEDGRDSLMDLGLLGRESPGSVSKEPTKDKKPTEKDGLYADDLKFNVEGELSDGNDEKHTIRVLEQALEEEQAAHSALYLELDKERSAAATAADEAMAMILRLQGEKASIEMEARQYQRMIEEKSAYDFEEMNILKEILLRREKEKHFLEKEVETYRQMIFGSEQLDSDAQDIGTSRGRRASSLLYSSEDPVLMLQKISESFYETEHVENTNKFSECEVTSIVSQDHSLAFGKELPIPELDGADSSKQGCIPREPSVNKYHCLSGGNGEINEKFEEIRSLSWERSSFSQETDMQSLEMHTEINLPTAEGYTSSERFNTSVGEIKQQGDVISTSQGSPNSIQPCDVTKNIFPYGCDDSKKYDKDSSNGLSDTGPCVHDVHVIDDKLNLCDEVRGNGRETLSEIVSLDFPKSCNSPVMNRRQTEQHISRSCSEITSGLPPRGFLQRKPLVSDLRRNSMSAVDYERFKIDNEVGWLRERLRIIQEGREKLNISLEHREKENVQLLLLENIVSQLQEIRQLTEPGNAVRQVSLPPPSCKIMSKKRRWRSVSLEVHRST
ncbi:uncharacterized protein LOC8280667 [Ricinus communis]|uniref:uncharacterized protein LOC8280667 n=1 Tax=Ricinus communis TaxID=3988 RepID=UPI00201A9A60|nr:uncharacterized protein LOC8280667 [Ricinus communis]